MPVANRKVGQGLPNLDCTWMIINGDTACDCDWHCAQVDVCLWPHAATRITAKSWPSSCSNFANRENVRPWRESPMATPVLDPIKLVGIKAGGYQITCKSPLAAGMRRFLCVEGSKNRVDITGGYNATSLPSLLKCIKQLSAWGTSCNCWVVDEQGGRQVSESEAQGIACPVKPFDGAFTFDGFKNHQPKLTYPGNGKGRTLIEIDGEYHFCNAGKLETDNTMRGFDCTTFPMALFKCNVNMSGKWGTALAVALGAEKCDMEQKKEPDIKAFFTNKVKSSGLFIMWSGGTNSSGKLTGHVVLLKNNEIHEFATGGYKRTSVTTWPGYRRAPNGLWWMRKLPASLNP
jgi:hypothetical protein